MSFQTYEQLEAAMTRLREQEERIRGFQAARAEARTTVVSKDRMVTVTVGGEGRVTDLVIKGNRHRSMSSAQFSSTLMETVNSALEQAATEAMQAARGLLPASTNLAGLDQNGKVDISALFNSVLANVEGPLSPHVPPNRTGA